MLGTSLSKMLRARSKGQALVITMLLMAALLAASAIFLRAVISDKWSSELTLQKEKAFYLAEAGLEEAKSALASNPSWFTDNPHSPDLDAGWILDKATGAVKQFGGGSFKIVRESGKSVIYSAGYFKRAKVVLSTRFIPSPFSSNDFKIL